MNEEELKLLEDMKEHCKNQAMYNDPHAIQKYRCFEMLENKINELEKEKKHLIDLQRNMDKQYELMESVLDEIRRCINNTFNISSVKDMYDVLDGIEKILDKVQK